MLCMGIVEQLKKQIEEAISEMGALDVQVSLERAADVDHGDFTTNIAFALSKPLKKTPMEIAEQLSEGFRAKRIEGIERVESVAPGFVNFFLSEEYLVARLQGNQGDIGDRGSKGESSSGLRGKRIMVEYAHPNTHKEMHIGHMRTLITGEAIARLAEMGGAKVFRANYQGDIGPHVAKALWGIQEIMKRENLRVDTGSLKLEFEDGGSKVEKDNVALWGNAEKAHFLGRGYALGSQEYEENKEAIDGINKQLYEGVAEYSSNEVRSSQPMASNNKEIWELYQETRQWSLDYYKDLYERFYTQFDRLFFESEMVVKGKDIVKSNVGKVFEEANGAIVFSGEEYGLHTRVFITRVGNPTYEGKEMANAYAEYDAFPFDQKVHVVGSEQAGYFQVVFKALELLDPEKFSAKQKHISMGMVILTDRKMSSRTGDILRVDWLLDQIRERVEKLVTDERVPVDMREEIIEQIVVGAVKYSVLKVGTGQNVSFDIEKSVSLEGNSGPYIQYTYARTQSVLRKAEGKISNVKYLMSNVKYPMSNVKLGDEDVKLLRLLVHFEDVVNTAAEKYSPSLVADYIYELAQAFNLFYQKAQILKEKDDIRNFRLALTGVVGDRIKTGLHLLGIKAPERM